MFTKNSFILKGDQNGRIMGTFLPAPWVIWQEILRFFGLLCILSSTVFWLVRHPPHLQESDEVGARCVNNFYCRKTTLFVYVDYVFQIKNSDST